MTIIKKEKVSQFANDCNNFWKLRKGIYLSDIYASYSANKKNAWKWCYEKFVNTSNSEMFAIISYNCNFFSVAWFGDYVDKETGEVFKAFYRETYKNSYITIYCIE